MIKFGELKSKILQKLVECYSNGDHGEIKSILSEISKNRDFKDMYRFYEDMEYKNISDKETATVYVEGILPILKEKEEKIREVCKTINKKVKSVGVETNPIYKSIDILMEGNTLHNVDKKIEEKNKLINHLLTKKEKPLVAEHAFTKNENLLHNLLTNNFNVQYANTLSESEKMELKSIITMDAKTLVENFDKMRDEVKESIDTMVISEQDETIKNKLVSVREEMKLMSPTRINYYKLKQLKTGL